MTNAANNVHVKLTAFRTDELVDAAHGRVQDIVYEDEHLQHIAHVVACRQLGLDGDIVVFGGDAKFNEDGKYIISEDDPRHDQYWEYTTRFWAKVFARVTEASAGHFMY